MLHITTFVNERLTGKFHVRLMTSQDARSWTAILECLLSEPCYNLLYED